MITILLIISAVSLVVGYLVYFKKQKIRSHKIDWIILLLPLIGSVGIIWYSFTLTTPIDVRLVEYEAQSIRHYPTWVEEVRERSKEDSACGQPIRVYNVKHEEYYAMMYTNSIGEVNEKEIPKTTYEYYEHLWQNPDSCGEELSQDYIIDKGNRKFSEYFWNGEKEKSLVYSKTEPYINYFKNILTIYNFEHVGDKEAEELGLFQRARMDIVNNMGVLEPRQTLIYGLKLSDSLSHASSYLSTFDHRFRPILIVWVGKGNKEEMIEKQRSYWGGGKDNEAVFCVCLNDTVRKGILWSGSFSWAENKDFENYVCMASLHLGEKLDIEKYIESCEDGYNNELWKPRKFENYSIAKMPIDQIAYIVVSVVIIILSLILITRVFKRRTNE